MQEAQINIIAAWADPVWFKRVGLSILTTLILVFGFTAWIQPNMFMLVEALNGTRFGVHMISVLAFFMAAYGSWKLAGPSEGTALLIILGLLDMMYGMQAETFWVLRMAEDAHTTTNFNPKAVNITNFVYSIAMIFLHLGIFACLGVAKRRVWVPILTFFYGGFWIFALSISYWV